MIQANLLFYSKASGMIDYCIKIILGKSCNISSPVVEWGYIVYVVDVGAVRVDP